MLSKILQKLDIIYEKEKPDGVIVYGDTNSSLSAAICAKKRNIPLFHIESGVRNYDENMPEESNRYLIDRISNINFCATELNVKNLINEGFNSDTINSKIVKSGDVMYDLFKQSKNNQKSKIISKKKDFILCTIHRESNVEEKDYLKNIIMALNELSKSTPVILISHPRTKKKIFKRNLICNFDVIDPIDYQEMITYLISCKYVITDSGGLVREAYFAKKKSLFILDNPVWPEIISQKYCINVPPNKIKILKSLKKLSKNKGAYKEKIFGNGYASSIIVKKIINFLN
jgi:UDP-GlcNAc3NAcA epimerase